MGGVESIGRFLGRTIASIAMLFGKRPAKNISDDSRVVFIEQRETDWAIDPASISVVFVVLRKQDRKYADMGADAVKYYGKSFQPRLLNSPISARYLVFATEEDDGMPSAIGMLSGLRQVAKDDSVVFNSMTVSFEGPNGPPIPILVGFCFSSGEHNRQVIQGYPDGCYPSQ